MNIKSLYTSKVCSKHGWRQLKPGYGEKLQALLFMLGCEQLDKDDHTWDILMEVRYAETRYDVLSYNEKEQWEGRVEPLKEFLEQHEVNLEGLLNEHSSRGDT